MIFVTFVGICWYLLVGVGHCNCIMVKRGKKTVKKVIDTEPQWSEQKLSVSFFTADTGKWYAIFKCRYEHGVPETVSKKWNDIPSAGAAEHPLKETHGYVSISPESSISFIIYYSNGRIKFQGLSVAAWREYEWPILQTIYNTTPNSEYETISKVCGEAFSDFNVFMDWAPRGQMMFPPCDVPWKLPIPNTDMTPSAISENGPTDEDEQIEDIRSFLNDIVSEAVLFVSNPSPPAVPMRDTQPHAGHL